MREPSSSSRPSAYVDPITESTHATQARKAEAIYSKKSGYII